MTYRTILAYADASDEAAVRLEISAALAARNDAVLEGVFVSPPFIPTPAPEVAGGGYVAPETWQVLLDSHQAVVARAEEAARSRFTAAADAARARAEWTTLEDGVANGFVGAARCSDLVVFPMSGAAPVHLSPMELARDSAAPLLLVPKSPASRQIGHKVLVAWNGSREAASALRGAWPILETAEVDLLMIDPPPEAEAFIGKRLKRHGVKARMHISRSPDAQAGEMIKDHAESLGVDLVVMGLYGHSRLRELVLGGASRTMLTQESFPLLVSR